MAGTRVTARMVRAYVAEAIELSGQCGEPAEERAAALLRDCPAVRDAGAAFRTGQVSWMALQEAVLRVVRQQDGGTRGEVRFGSAW